MRNFITLTLFMTFTLSTVEAHNVVPDYPSDKKVVKIEKIVIKGVTYTLETVTSSLLQECTVTVTSEAKFEGDDSSGLTVTTSATEKNCRKARRKANRKLRRLLR